MKSWIVYVEERRVLAVELVSQDRNGAIKRVEGLNREQIEGMRGFRVMANERKFDAIEKPSSLP